MTPNILIIPVTLFFDGFEPAEFPLENGEMTMNLLYQRVITQRYETVTGPRGRVYYNLVVLSPTMASLYA